LKNVCEIAVSAHLACVLSDGCLQDCIAHWLFTSGFFVVF